MVCMQKGTTFFNNADFSTHILDYLLYNLKIKKKKNIIYEHVAGMLMQLAKQ